MKHKYGWQSKAGIEKEQRMQLIVKEIKRIERQNYERSFNRRKTSYSTVWLV